MDPSLPSPKAASNWKRKLILPLLFFTTGVGAAGWGVTQTEFGRSLTGLQPPAPITIAPRPTPTPPNSVAPDQASRRIAELEDSLARARSGGTVSSAGGSSRAEGLLLAFAARRALELGLPLGSFEQELAAHFGTAQPHLVAAVVAAAHTPITLATLQLELTRLTPQLAGTQGTGMWERVTNGFSNLVSVRRGGDVTQDPKLLLDQARIAMSTGNVDAALQAISRMPNRAVAADWMTSARRYSEAQRALTALEKSSLEGPTIIDPPITPTIPDPAPSTPGSPSPSSALPPSE
jgi:hypothetical protein